MYFLFFSFTREHDREEASRITEAREDKAGIVSEKRGQLRLYSMNKFQETEKTKNRSLNVGKKIQ